MIIFGASCERPRVWAIQANAGHNGLVHERLSVVDGAGEDAKAFTHRYAVASVRLDWRR